MTPEPTPEPTAVVQFTLSDHRVGLDITGRTVAGEHGSAAVAHVMLKYRRGVSQRWYLVEAQLHGCGPFSASLGRFDQDDIDFHTAHPEYGTVPAWVCELVAQHLPTSVPA